MIVTIDRYTKTLLTVIAVLLTVVAAGLWCHTPSTIESAYALVDSGQQLEYVMNRMDKLVVSVDGMAGLMKSGNMKVQIVEGKNKSVVMPSLPTVKSPNTQVGK